MKKSILFLVLITLLLSCEHKLSEGQRTKLWNLYREQNYFKLDHAISQVEFNYNNPDLLLFKAKLENVFNNPAKSNEMIHRLLLKYPNNFNDTLVGNLYEMKAINDMRLQNFREAFLDDSIILKKYTKVYDSVAISSFKNDQSIFKCLSKVPKMQIVRNSDCRIPIKRDMAGLFNIPIHLSQDTIQFVFDTGANMSAINKSLATKYGAKIIGNNINLGGSTGKEVKAEIGVLDIKLGSIELKNAVFIVMPDSDLIFDGGKYSIKGIIGFPIMYDLQEFCIKEDKYLLFPQKIENSGPRNLALDELYMVGMVIYESDTLPFHFDSGANTTNFFSAFYNKYKRKIAGHCKKEIYESESVGGGVKSEVFKLDTATISIGNSQAKLSNISLYTLDLQKESVKYFYGNLGQDFIRQFSEMNVNLKSMNLSFKNKGKFN